MIEQSAQQPDLNPASIKNDEAEEGNRSIHELDQQRQEILIHCDLHNEMISLVIICGALLVMILSILLWFSTKAVLPLFVSIVAVYPGYRLVNAWFDRYNSIVT